MPATILITRPLKAAHSTAQYIEKNGYKCICEPLSAIRFLPESNARLRLALTHAPAALMATSSNGVTALANGAPARTMPLYVVGEGSAKTAQALGFLDVRNAHGAAPDLARRMLADFAGTQATVLYAAGLRTAHDMSALLAPLRVECIQAYEAVASDALSAHAQTALLQGNIDAVLFFSRRAGGVWQRLIAQHELAPVLSAVQACCMSAAVAQEVRGLPWKAVHAACKPNLASMLACVDNALQWSPP